MFITASAFPFGRNLSIERRTEGRDNPSRLRQLTTYLTAKTLKSDLSTGHLAEAVRGTFGCFPRDRRVKRPPPRTTSPAPSPH
ncbi:hypothetical protein BV898_06977 [Hypsibius exemplaris]|uniref:Uncharacterized protein n=1 Tax=Hypsibius exemplaris TaxID=2072580 RepID=A0A1W0WUP1_HYPEX|nr:hypothetical protein BV898_06977 [Hypsibius exemplaris]